MLASGLARSRSLEVVHSRAACEQSIIHTHTHSTRRQGNLLCKGTRGSSDRRVDEKEDEPAAGEREKCERSLTAGNRPTANRARPPSTHRLRAAYHRPYDENSVKLKTRSTLEGARSGSGCDLRMGCKNLFSRGGGFHNDRLDMESTPVCGDSLSRCIASMCSAAADRTLASRMAELSCKFLRFVYFCFNYFLCAEVSDRERRE